MDRPLATRMRPRNFKEFVGHHHLLGEGKPLTKLIDGGHLPSTILWGPPGTGKTTLAHLLAIAVGADFQQLSAVSSGVSDARRVMDHSKTRSEERRVGRECAEGGTGYDAREWRERRDGTP